MGADSVAYLLILGACLVASGFFSGSETALIGISKERVHQLAEQGGRGQRVQQLVADPDRMLSTLLVANNLANVLAAAVATTLFISLIGATWGPWVATAVMTALLLIFGEITPKTIAARHPERFALRVGPAIWQMSRVLGPLANFFAAITRGLLRLIRVSVDSEHGLVTEEDIRALAELGQRSGHIEQVEREIIDALFDIADRPVRDVMTPRVDIVTLTEPVTMEVVRATVGATGHSRYPVIGHDLDDLSGMLYVKDLLQRDRDPTSSEISSVLRNPNYVLETATILNTLQEMRQRKFTIGVVLDEHGGVEGVVTVKDLMSELVGELQDEYDPGAPSVVKIGAEEWLADGRLPLEELEAEIGVELPDGPYSTIAGLFMALSGRVPADGDGVSVADLDLTVLQMDRNRVDRIRVERSTP